MFGLIIVIGLIIGSFLNLCIHRIPLGKSIIGGRSYCPKCKHNLKALDLIPVLSYIILRGKCRYCQEPISLRYPTVEVLNSIQVFTIYSFYGLTWEFAFYSLWVAILLLVSAIDLKHYIIPNPLIMIGMILGLIFPVINPGLGYIGASLGLAVGFGTLFVIALLTKLIIGKEGLGGGDIKLLGMIGMFLGWKLTLLALLLSIYMGGILSVFLLLLEIKKRGDYVPFGPLLSLGAFISLLWGKDLIKWYTLFL